MSGTVTTYQVFGQGANSASPFPITIINNVNATTDPTTANDITQGYQQGSAWGNTTNGRNWVCQQNTKGAAVWAFDGATTGTTAAGTPSALQTQMGGSTASFRALGTLYSTVSATGFSATTTAADYVIAAYTLPLSVFDQATRGVQIQAIGTFGSTANNKTIKILWNPTTAVVGNIAVALPGVTASTSGVTASNAGGFSINAEVYKYGAAGSNTQIALNTGAFVGAVAVAPTAPALTTASETGSILIAVTANCANAASDVLLNYFTVIGID